MIKKEIDFNTPLSEEQKAMLEALKNKSDIPDDDFPELSAEQLSQFKRVSKERREERRKQTVTLRLSPQALKKARSLGKGYTSVLSRILENALNDNEIIKRSL